MKKLKVVRCPHCGYSSGTQADKTTPCRFCQKMINLTKKETIVVEAKDYKECARLVRNANASLFKRSNYKEHEEAKKK